MRINLCLESRGETYRASLLSLHDTMPNDSPWRIASANPYGIVGLSFVPRRHKLVFLSENPDRLNQVFIDVIFSNWKNVFDCNMPKLHKATELLMQTLWSSFRFTKGDEFISQDEATKGLYNVVVDHVNDDDSITEFIGNVSIAEILGSEKFS
jgi:hypothetical protein